MKKTKNRRVVEKPSVLDFYEDLIEDIPTCLESYYLDDNVEEDNFPDEIIYKDSSEDEEIPEEEEEEVMRISPLGGKAREKIASAGVHWFEPSDASDVIRASQGVQWFEPSDASDVIPAVVPQEECDVPMEIRPDPLTALSEPLRKTPCESDMCIPAEQVQKEPPGCPEQPSPRPDFSFRTVRPIEDEILSIFPECAENAAAPDESSGVLTRLEDVRLSDIPVTLRSPLPSPVLCPVSEATHYFSQYLEVRFTTRWCSPTHTTHAPYLPQSYRFPVSSCLLFLFALTKSSAYSFPVTSHSTPFFAVRYWLLQYLPIKPLRISKVSHSEAANYAPSPIH
jgi:hypothetical protein